MTKKKNLSVLGSTHLSLIDVLTTYHISLRNHSENEIYSFPSFAIFIIFRTLTIKKY